MGLTTRSSEGHFFPYRLLHVPASTVHTPLNLSMYLVRLLHIVGVARLCRLPALLLSPQIHSQSTIAPQIIWGTVLVGCSQQFIVSRIASLMLGRYGTRLTLGPPHGS